MTDQLTLAFGARDRGIRQVTDNSDDQDRAVVDQAILTYAETGRRFSANTFRDDLPEIRNRNLIGARIRSLAMRGLIVKAGEETSTDPGTHAKPITVWMAPSTAAEWGIE